MTISIKTREGSLEEGRWKSATWNFFISDTIPSEEKVTAVFGVPIYEGGLVMTKNYRGWELPGGHREIGESLKETLAREIYEEAGITSFETSEKPVGYLEVVDDEVVPKINKATGAPYPNPGYVVFYAVKVTAPPGNYTDRETLDSKIFPLDNLPEIEGETIKKILKHLIN